MASDESCKHKTRMLHILIFWITLLGQTTQNDNHVILEEVTWGEGYTECRNRGLKLLNSTNIGSMLAAGSGKHWIGLKVMYSSWKWTEDSTNLFAYVGYHETTNKDSVQKNLQYDNDAVRCYLECKTKHVGLQGPLCFCFNSAPPTTNNSEQETCLGNSEEFCGSSHGMSIYRAELFQESHRIINWKFKSDDICGYINAKKGKLNVKTDMDCLRQKGMICSCVCSHGNIGGKRCLSDVCYVDSIKQDWFSSNDNCSLIKLNATNAERVNRGVWDSVQYWIGMKRYSYVGWSDRVGVVSNYTKAIRGCVAVEKFLNGSLVFYVSPCDDRKKAICSEGVKLQTITTLATTTTAYSGTIHSVTTGPSTSIVTTYNSTEKELYNPSDDVIVGVVLAVVAGVIVLVVVGSIVWMKRTKRHCFKDVTTKHGMKSSLSNEMIFKASTNEYATPYYSEVNGGFKRDDSPVYTYVTASYEFEHPPIKPRPPPNEYLELIPDVDVAKEPTDHHKDNMSQHKQEMGQSKQEMGQLIQEMGQRIQEMGQRNQEMAQRKQEMGQNKQEICQQKQDMDQRNAIGTNNEITYPGYSTPYEYRLAGNPNVNSGEKPDEVNPSHPNKSSHLHYSTVGEYELADDPNDDLKEVANESIAKQPQRQFSHPEYCTVDAYELAGDPDGQFTEESHDANYTETNSEISHPEYSIVDPYELAGDPNVSQTNNLSTGQQYTNETEHSGYNVLHASNHQHSNTTCNTSSYDHIHSAECSDDFYDKAGQTKPEPFYNSIYSHIRDGDVSGGYKTSSEA